METIMSRGTANTRMRDFYDVHTIVQQEKDNLDMGMLKKAFRESGEAVKE